MNNISVELRAVEKKLFDRMVKAPVGSRTRRELSDRYWKAYAARKQWEAGK